MRCNSQRAADLQYIMHKHAHNWIQTFHQTSLFHQDCNSHNLLSQLDFMLLKYALIRLGLEERHVFYILISGCVGKRGVRRVALASSKCISVACNHKSIFNSLSFPLWNWSFSVIFWCSRKTFLQWCRQGQHCHFIDFFFFWWDIKQNWMMQTSQFERNKERCSKRGRLRGDEAGGLHRLDKVTAWL